MNEDKIQDILLQLLSDMAYVKAKLDNLDEQKLNARIDALEAQNREHNKSIKSLEHRNDVMEQFTRNNLTESKKTMMGIYSSIGIAIFSAILTIIINLF